MTVFEFETLIVSMVVLASVGVMMLILVWLKVKWLRTPGYLWIYVLAVAGLCGQSVWMGRDSPGLYTRAVTAPRALAVTSVAVFGVPPRASEVREITGLSGQYLVDARSRALKGQTLYLVTRRRMWGHATQEFACPAPRLAECWPVERSHALNGERRAGPAVINSPSP